MQQYARSNDFVALPFASAKLGADLAYIKPQDLTVTLTTQPGTTTAQTHRVQVTDTLRVSGSSMSTYNQLSYGENSFAPNDVEWIAVIRLVDGSGQPLSLTPGKATFNIQSPKLSSHGLYLTQPLSAIPIEIISGVSASNNTWNDSAYYYRSMLRESEHIEIRPENSNLLSTVGGAQYTLRYLSTASTKLLPVSKSFPNDNVQLITSYDDDGTYTTLKILVVNPYGFKQGLDGQALSGDSLDRVAADINDLHIKVGASGSLFSNWDTEFQLIAGESYYIDLNGSPINSTLPVILCPMCN